MLATKALNSKYVPKLYEKMGYLVQRILIDVKFIPIVYFVNGAKTMVLSVTAINKYSCWNFDETSKEHSSYSFVQF